ncbi:hypothetical protein [Geovibrio ferrireducens]|jgi:hypothetical protein|uniref:hypothetical protein n=1 Tax=Geovibrio ferrireducens TaxID=46201 RepID=UPI002247025E|nr:hypothetical protein [Geovibrio ferrireducens]
MSILIAAMIFFSAQSADCSQASIKTEYISDSVHTAYIYPIEDERRGCCSKHGGVCGCSNGRALCCDGTLSPTCGCD